MEVNVDILRPFFRYPNKGYTIREAAHAIGINHTTVRKYLIYYVKEGLLIKKASKPYNTFISDTSSKKYTNLKLYYNLELLRESGITEALEKEYAYPPIVLFGSFSKATDDETSDIDICVVSEIKKEFDVSGFGKKLYRNVSMHRFTKAGWKDERKKSPELVNNIANGITLSGQLEIL